jgi:hypothetical protein
MSGRDWKPKTIYRFIESIPTSTKVIRVETDAGDGFLKAMGNPEGPHTLACEWVGTQLAEWLGLSTFDYSLIEVHPDDELPFAGGGFAQPGPAFITRAVEGFSWGGDVETLGLLSDASAISGLMVLDTWIRNCDRHRPEPQLRMNHDNVFLARQDGLTLKAMDYTHSFTCGTDLSRALAQVDVIQDEMIFGGFGEFAPFVNRDDLTAWALQLERMSSEIASRMVGSVPEAWEVTETARAAWVRFIAERAKFIRSQLPSWRAYGG